MLCETVLVAIAFMLWEEMNPKSHMGCCACNSKNSKHKESGGGQSVPIVRHRVEQIRFILH
jgi:hypothetical protein